uniref:Uncharacterized protein n=1 Tax=Panagrolaimus sp. ES5 TaxID=591445 RepID=A0AC34G7Z9_9BILA
MGGVISAVKRVVIEPIFCVLKTAFQCVIKFFEASARMIRDVVFSQLQFEYSSQQNQDESRELIAEQRRKKLVHRQRMTCKCGRSLLDFVFDCGHMACTQCNGSTCSVHCFECQEIIRDRTRMDYDRSILN